MSSLDETSEAIGQLRAQISAVFHVVNDIDRKVDGLGGRMIAVEQFKGRFEDVEAKVQRHDALVQRGLGVWAVLTIVVSAGWSFAADALRRWF